MDQRGALRPSPGQVLGDAHPLKHGIGGGGVMEIHVWFHFPYWQDWINGTGGIFGGNEGLGSEDKNFGPVKFASLRTWFPEATSISSKSKKRHPSPIKKHGHPPCGGENKTAAAARRTRSTNEAHGSGQAALAAEAQRILNRQKARSCLDFCRVSRGRKASGEFLFSSSSAAG